MKQKLISNKKIIICACAASAVVIVAVIALLANKEEAFRSILVYDVEGSAVIERENVGAMNAAENLYLESGDRVSVAEESSMRMKLDDDKYVMAEADTIFSVEAEGTEADSKTRICLEQGAITNEIRHPLSEGSQYETSTPNSVMAVRGTVYRVELYMDENGSRNTKLSCFQGKVGAKPILPDGAFGEEVLVPAGSELVVYQDGTVSEVGDIAYQELPLQAIENLLGMMENGQEITGISAEDLTQLTLETENVSEAAGSEPAQTQEPGQPEKAETDIQSDTNEETDTQIHTKSVTAKNAPTKSTPKGQKSPTPQPQPPAVKLPKAPEPVKSGNAGQGNTGGEGSRDENNGDDSDKDKSDEDDKEKDKPSKPNTCKVTFMYQGRVFATQTVKSGETAAVPVLVPEQSGAWDFDFGAKIEANTTISWK